MAGGVDIELGVAVLEKIAAKLDALDVRLTAIDDYIRGSGKSQQAQPPRFAGITPAEMIRAQETLTQIFEGRTK